MKVNDKVEMRRGGVVKIDKKCFRTIDRVDGASIVYDPYPVAGEDIRLAVRDGVIVSIFDPEQYDGPVSYGYYRWMADVQRMYS